MAWTLLSPYIVSCPAGNPHIEWQNFPALNITVSNRSEKCPHFILRFSYQSNPSATPLFNSTTFGNSTLPAITQNRTIPLSTPGRQVQLSWELPGNVTGYNNSYTTNTVAGSAQVRSFLYLLARHLPTTSPFTVRGMDFPAEHYVHSTREHHRHDGYYRAAWRNDLWK